MPSPAPDPTVDLDQDFASPTGSPISFETDRTTPAARGPQPGLVERLDRRNLLIRDAEARIESRVNGVSLPGRSRWAG